MNSDPRDIVGNANMSKLQIIAVAMCVLLNALDGFDVLAISFASPGIASEWGIQRGALGIVLSMELIGMAIGSVLLGGVADKIGRRPTILGCLVVMAGGMLLAAFASSIIELSIIRFVTGLGIGGMLAATNAMVAEWSSRKHRSLAVTLMATGYPVGAIVGGSVASVLLANFDWRSVFFFGAAVTSVFIPLVVIVLPESVSYLTLKRPANALERINKTLQRMGHAVVTELPEIVADSGKKAGFGKLFEPQLRNITLLLTVAYFAHIMTFYFILKWIPKIVVDMGFEPSSAGSVLVWANVGGAAGALLLGVLTQKFDVNKLVVGALVMATVLVTVFGYTKNDLSQLALMAAVAGFFTNAGIVGLYAMFAHSFPTEVRAGGTGFVIGIGRGGAALGPIVAGFLFEAGKSLPTVSTAMALGSLIGAIAIIILIKLLKARHVSEQAA